MAMSMGVAWTSCSIRSKPACKLHAFLYNTRHGAGPGSLVDAGGMSRVASAALFLRCAALYGAALCCSALRVTGQIRLIHENPET